MHRAAVTVLSIGLLGCQGDGLAVPFDSSQALTAPTGLYSVHVETVSDTCAPVRASGDQGSTLIEVNERQVTIGAPELPQNFFRFALPRTSSYRWTLPSKMSCGAVYTPDIQLIAASDRSVEIELIETWSNIAACAEILSVNRDCRSERLVRYDFVKTCPTPIHEVVGADGTVDCQ